ncbi:hypothetical protein SCP_1304040 [Sparassis crispa]|uniref:Uncharacterized protein n=1 Tax=Sparassis crispa TaxID=139825 RepID=A0A401H2C2_9APHY|nr:hypothetical protein SCP_1304040 [Sparassis crispa]GBE88587.1 hypothetical protein SCP_1304040 [Sparassis crispa]
MKPKLVAFMTKRQERRLKWERIGTVKSRLALLSASLEKAGTSLKANDAFPHAVDLTSFIEIRTIVELPSSIHITDEAFDQILPDLISRWQIDVMARLKTKFTDIVSISGCPEPLEFLNFAKTAFECSSCRRMLFWPMVASHYRLPKNAENGDRYANLPSLSHSFIPSVDTPVFDAAVQGEFGNRKQRTRAPIRPCSEQAVYVIEACEMDAGTATIAQMDELDARVSCRLCSVPGESKLVMTWRAAISHSLTAHHFPPAISESVGPSYRYNRR